MKIQSISFCIPKNNRKTNVNSTKLNNHTSFKGSYYSTYKEALNTNLNRYSEATSLFKRLVNAAKTENGLFKGTFYNFLEKGPKEALKLAESSSKYQENLLTSTSHKSPLITMESGVISFHHPEYGEFGNGNISFWLSKNNDLNVSRPKNYRKFYENGCIKESYDKYEDGSGIYNHEYFDRDGSKPFLKNFLLGD